EQFHSVLEARVVIAEWVERYNTLRPHRGLGMKTSAQFAAEWRAQAKEIASPPLKKQTRRPSQDDQGRNTGERLMRAAPTTRTGPVTQRRRCRQRPQHRPESHSAWTDSMGAGQSRSAGRRSRTGPGTSPTSPV